MDNIYLVAVEHAEDAFLSPNMELLIKGVVVPRLTSESVIVAEGGNFGEVGPGHPRYLELLSCLGMDVFNCPARPLLYANDPAFNSQRERAINKDMDLQPRYDEECDKVLMIHEPPSTWGEMVLLVMEKKHNIALNGKLPKRWRQFARKICEETRVRDEAFAAQVHKYAKRGVPVFLFAGAVHAISLQAQYMWQVIRLETTPETSRSLYRTWFVMNKIADLFS